MTEYEAWQLVASMRAHQKKYFATRSDEELRICQGLERRVDDYISAKFQTTLQF